MIEAPPAAGGSRRATRLDLTGIWRRFGPRGRQATALDGVDLQVSAGEIVALVGESGSGKTTLARIAAGLDRPDQGRVTLDGAALTDPRGRMAPGTRHAIQMVFQDPLASFNPRRSIGAAVELPLRLAGTPAATARTSMLDLLQSVGLDATHAARRPDALSGGQLQRAAIARALATDPAILICDEPVASLDVSVRAQVLNLLVDLQRRRGLGILFVSHDLGVVQRIADRTVVLYLGRVVEKGGGDLWRAPLHPYTRALAAAVPDGARPWRERPRDTAISGEMPTPFDIPAGCRFRTRCPLALADCARIDPALRPAGPDHGVACLRVQTTAPGA
jgi:oligopeptide/dipeptide ABC transporter ATP-binding protein